MIELTGRSLTTEQIVQVARHGVSARLGEEAIARMRRSRAVVDVLLESRVKVYGLTTGFGSKKNVFIEPEETVRLQQNLIRSHSCGVGEPLTKDVVRATIVLRANTLALGLSGIRVSVVRALLALLEHDIYPWIPSQGSLGASGDLAPLSHLALVLMGDPDGQIEISPGRFGPSTPEALAARGFSPVTLKAKEGLALNNGTQVMTAIGLLTVADAHNLVACSEGATAMSFEALSGVRTAFDARLHAARPHEGQRKSADNLRRHTNDSQILRLPVNMARINATIRHLDDALFHVERDASPLSEDIAANIREGLALLKSLREDPELPLGDSPIEPEGRAAYRHALDPVKQQLLRVYTALLSSTLRPEVQQAQEDLSSALSSLEHAVPAMAPVQDSYSLRCAPQVIGASRQVIDHVESVLLTEANSATDNPLIFAPDIDADDIDSYREALTPPLCREAVCSGGNFHGQPVAVAMDYLAIGIAEIGSISERRTAHMIDGHLNQGLPSLLVHKAGLNSGFMVPQYTAAALVSENKSLAHPASVDSIPSCENTEDHVSMGTIAARKARSILLNAESIVAIELLTAFQALHFHAPLAPGCAARALATVLREAGVEFVAEDRPLWPDIAKVLGLIRSGDILRALDAYSSES
jgi:histidine ammonia-lyase